MTLETTTNNKKKHTLGKKHLPLKEETEVLDSVSEEKCSRKYDIGGKIYVCGKPLIAGNDFCVVCQPKEHTKKNKEIELKLKKIAQEKKKIDAEARRQETASLKKIAQEKKKENAKTRQEDLENKMKNKLMADFERDKKKLSEAYETEIEILVNENDDLKYENLQLQNQLNQFKKPSKPTKAIDNCFYCSNWRDYKRAKDTTMPCTFRRVRGSYYCENHQANSKTFNWNRETRNNYLSYGHKVKYNYLTRIFNNDDLVIPLDKFSDDKGICFFFKINNFFLIYIDRR